MCTVHSLSLVLSELAGCHNGLGNFQNRKTTFCKNPLNKLIAIAHAADKETLEYILSCLLQKLQKLRMLSAIAD